MCANRVHLEKKRNAMRGGTYEQLLGFLDTRHHEFTKFPMLRLYFSNCDQRIKDAAVLLYDAHKLEPRRLEQSLSELRLFEIDYSNALYSANYNKTKFPEEWKTKLDTKFETPEQYALDFATRSAIIRKQPPAQSKIFYQPASGTFGGV